MFRSLRRNQIIIRQCSGNTTFEEKTDPERNRTDVCSVTTLTPYRQTRVEYLCHVRPKRSDPQKASKTSTYPTPRTIAINVVGSQPVQSNYVASCAFNSCNSGTKTRGQCPQNKHTIVSSFYFSAMVLTPPRHSERPAPE